MALAEPQVRLLSKSEIDVLVSEHQDYAAKCAEWDECLAFWKGWPLVADKIYRHVRESRKAHKWRAERAFYRNHLDSIVDLWVDFVFSQPIVRKAQSHEEWWKEEFWKDYDLHGNCADHVMSEALKTSQVLGDCPLLVDVPRAQAPVRSEADRKAQRIRPYVVALDPRQLVDWEVDKDGELEWARVKHELPQGRSPWSKASDEKVCEYRIVTKEYWTLIVLRTEGNQRTAFVEAEGEVRGGRVPLVMLYPRKRVASKKFRGDSPILNMARIARTVFNYDSIMDESNYQQTIPVLAVEGAEAPKDEDEDIVVGAFNSMSYPRGTSRPGYIERPTASLQLIEDKIGKLIEELYRQARLGGSYAQAKPVQVPSGVAAAWLFHETNKALAAKADAAEQAEDRVNGVVAGMLGIEDDTEIDYPDQFNVEDFMTQLDQAKAMKEAVRSPTAKREAEKRMVLKYFAKVDEKVVQKMLDEIDGEEEPEPTGPYAPDFPKPPEDEEGEGVEPQPERKED